MKSKFSTSIKGGKVKFPSAFTEKGLYIYSAEDFRKRREQGEHFIINVMNGPLTPLIGNPDDA